MKHKHRIIPGYEGGDYVEGNVVELTPTQHAMWHYAEWRRKGKEEDLIAWRGLSGLISTEESVRLACKLGGQKGGKVRGEQLRKLGHSPESNEKRRKAMIGKTKTPEMKENSSVAAKNRWSKPGAKDRFLAIEAMWRERLQSYNFSDRKACSEAAKEYGVSYACIRGWAVRLGLRKRGTR